jgi:hypothetical protein
LAGFSSQNRHPLMNAVLRPAWDSPLGCI